MDRLRIPVVEIYVYGRGYGYYEMDTGRIRILKSNIHAPLPLLTVLSASVKCSSQCYVNAFSALMLLVGWQEENPTHKKTRVTTCWHGYLSGARCKRLAYGPADATATPPFLLYSKIQNGSSFWYRLTQVVPDKGP